MFFFFWRGFPETLAATSVRLCGDEERKEGEGREESAPGDLPSNHLL